MFIDRRRGSHRDPRFLRDESGVKYRNCAARLAHSMMRAHMNGSKNHHILNAAANLLGVCFFIITGIHLTNISTLVEIDRAVLMASLLFLASCTLSYWSIRGGAHADSSEQYADYLFLGGIVVLFGVMLLLTFNITA